MTTDLNVFLLRFFAIDHHKTQNIAEISSHLVMLIFKMI